MCPFKGGNEKGIFFQVTKLIPFIRKKKENGVEGKGRRENKIIFYLCYVDRVKIKCQEGLEGGKVFRKEEIFSSTR